MDPATDPRTDPIPLLGVTNRNMFYPMQIMRQTTVGSQMCLDPKKAHALQIKEGGEHPHHGLLTRLRLSSGAPK